MRDEVTIKRTDDEGLEVALSTDEALTVAMGGAARLAADKLVEQLTGYGRPTAQIGQALIADATQRFADALGAELSRRSSKEPIVRAVLLAFAPDVEKSVAERDGNGRLVAVRKVRERPR